MRHRISVLVVLVPILSGCLSTQGTHQVTYDAALVDSTLPHVSVPSLPDTGQGPDPGEFRLANIRPAERPDVASDEAGLWMVVDRMEQRIATSGQLVRDPELSSYVSAVVCRLAGPYCPDIRTYVVYNPAFNASMAPNGMMVVHTGLLLRMENEAQLATVLGHEIGHYLRRHSLQRLEDLSDTAAGLLVFKLALAAVGTPQFSGVANAIAVQGMNAFSREQEREADGYGIVLLHNAGYDPREAHKIWERIIRERDARDEDSTATIFASTHPPSDERQAALQVLAEKLITDAPVGETGQQRFEEYILPHRARFFRDQLAVHDFEGSEELFTMLLETGTRKQETLYFLGELYRIRNEDGDLTKALEFYAEAERHGPAPADLYRSRGLIYWKQKKRVQARGELRRYLNVKPAAPDRKIIESMLGRS